MKFLFLGPLTSLLTQNLIISFYKQNYDLTIINTAQNSHVTSLQECPNVQIFNLYPISKTQQLNLKGKIRSKLRDILRGNKTLYRLAFKASHRKGFKEIPSIALEAMDILKLGLNSNNFDIIYAFWGAGVFPEIKSILDEKLNIPIVHDMQVYPYGFSSIGDDLSEIPENGEILNKIEGRLLCSKFMRQYLNDHFQFSYGRDVILMFYFNNKYFFREKLDSISTDNEPHIVFIGTTDFSNRPLDDIRKAAYKIAKSGIHIHLAEPDVKLRKSDKIHYYPRANPKSLIDGSLASFLTQFDASILIYNVNQKYHRFHNSFPSRFLFSLTAGIPIIMEEGYYASCEEFVKEYEIGFTYSDFDDLNLKLTNKKFMKKFKENALNLAIQRNFSFEKNFSKYDDFLNQIIREFKMNQG